MQFERDQQLLSIKYSQIDSSFSLKLDLAA